MLTAYKKELKAIRAGAQRRSEPRHKSNSRIQCDTPLTDQIEALMRSLPPAPRNRPWTMDELVARLRGRYNARPCAGSVGVALRRLGWTRIRDWSQDGEGRRVWRSLRCHIP